MAKRASVKMQNLFSTFNFIRRKRFLLTEALREEGLLDGHGRAYAHKYYRLEEFGTCYALV